MGLNDGEPAPLHKLRSHALVFVAGLSGGILFHLLNIPVAWLVGPTLSVGVLAACSSPPLPPLPLRLRLLPQIILGTTIGLSMPPEAPALLFRHTLPIIAVLTATMLLAIVAGWLIGRWANLDHSTAMMSSSPGGAAALVTISESLGADGIVVATLHYFRILAIISLVPAASIYLVKLRGTDEIIAGTLLTETPTQAVAIASPAQNLLLLVGILAAGTLTAWLLGRAGLPANWLVGPVLLAATARSLALPAMAVPEPLLKGAMVLVGAGIGAQVNFARLKHMRRVLAVGLGLVCMWLTGCVLLSYLLHLMTGLNLATAILALTPGAIEVIIPTALELGADMTWVTVMQVIRVFLFVFTLPWLVTARQTCLSG